MTQALTFYYPYVSAAYRKRRGVYTKVLEWRSFNTGQRESKCPIADAMGLERLRDGLARLLEG